MIDNYRILTSGEYNDLVKQVNASMKSGWKPQGGVCVKSYPGTDTFIFWQAIVSRDFRVTE